MKISVGLINDELNKSMIQSPWDATGSAASKYISRIIWNPIIYFRIHKSWPHVSVPFCFFKIHFNITPPSTVMSSKWFFPSD